MANLANDCNIREEARKNPCKAGIQTALIPHLIGTRNNHRVLQERCLCSIIRDLIVSLRPVATNRLSAIPYDRLDQFLKPPSRSRALVADS